MPSALHEAITEMLRAKPQLILTLLEAARAREPAHVTARITSEALPPRIPDYRADRVYEIFDGAGVLTAVLVLEVQLSWRSSKLFSWPVYQTVARARHRVPCIVVVVTPNERVARALKAPPPLGGGSAFRALVLGPDVLGPELVAVKSAPELAFLSALAHGDRHPEIVVDAVARFEELPRTKATLYFDLVLAVLSAAARRAVEAMMVSKLKNYEYQSEFARRYFSQGLEKGCEKGLERGLRRAIREVLDARGISSSDEHGRRLQGCTDSEMLRTWLRRAATAERASDIFEDH